MTLLEHLIAGALWLQASQMCATWWGNMPQRYARCINHYEDHKDLELTRKTFEPPWRLPDLKNCARIVPGINGPEYPPQLW